MTMLYVEIVVGQGSLVLVVTSPGGERTAYLREGTQTGRGGPQGSILNLARTIQMLVGTWVSGAWHALAA
jgi:hypothetical protein